MRDLRNRLAAGMTSFRRGDSGAATIEAVLWLPMFVFLLVLVADASFIFHRQALALRILQDGNRAFSTGRLVDADATAAYITASLGAFSPSATVVTQEAGGIITSVATIPLADLTAVGSIDVLSNGSLTVRSQHFLEY